MSGVDEADYDDALDRLEADAANDDVRALIEVVRTERRRRKRIERRYHGLLDRIDHLEDVTGVTIDVSDHEVRTKFDHRDREVLAAVAKTDPDRLTLRDLRELYRKRTDVRQPSSLRDRVRFLTEEGPFEPDGSQTWRYLGGDD